MRTPAQGETRGDVTVTGGADRCHAGRWCVL